MMLEPKHVWCVASRGHNWHDGQDRGLLHSRSSLAIMFVARHSPEMTCTQQVKQTCLLKALVLLWPPQYAVLHSDSSSMCSCTSTGPPSQEGPVDYIAEVR